MNEQVAKLISSLIPYNPDKIILFGSAAEGRYRKTSDLDVLVIKDTKELFWDRQKKVALMLKTDCDVDAFVLTPDEVKMALRNFQPFIYDIVHQGKVIYEKA